MQRLIPVLSLGLLNGPHRSPFRIEVEIKLLVAERWGGHFHKHPFPIPVRYNKVGNHQQCDQQCGNEPLFFAQYDVGHTQYPLVNKQLDPENNNFLMETNLPTPICQGLYQQYQRVIINFIPVRYNIKYVPSGELT